MAVVEADEPPSCHVRADLDQQERARLNALRRYAILDTPPEASLDRITRLAAQLLATPIALVSLVDRERQWFKSRHGLDLRETLRAGSLCGTAVCGDAVLEVPDARADPRFAGSPLVAGPPHIRFYAGAPLTTEDGHRIGALCVVDQVPRTLSPEQKRLLVDLAGLAVEYIRLRSSSFHPGPETAGCTQAQLLRRGDERYRRLLEASAAGIMIVQNGRITFANAAAAAMVGAAGRSALVGTFGHALPADIERCLRRSLRDGRVATVETTMRRPDGGISDIQVMAMPISVGGDAATVQLVLHDVSARGHGDAGTAHPAELPGIASGAGCALDDTPIRIERSRPRKVRLVSHAPARMRAEEQIRHLALHDPLTGLPNRRLFRDRLEQALALARREPRLLSVMIVDLDGFKEVNDALGHSQADALLCAVAARLRGVVRASDTLARIGGDEFAVIQSGLRSSNGAAVLAQKLIETIAKPFLVRHQEVHLTASIGIALVPEDGDSHDQMLRNADLALSRAKKEGRGCWRFFDESMHREVVLRRRLERDLRQALEREQLWVVYQPQLDPRTNRIVSAEALVRWRHPDRGLIPPGEFIPVAETTGLIRVLGRWILDAACRQASAWAQAGHPLRVAVNLSPAELRGHDLLATIDEVLGRHRLAPAFLELEITERLFVESSDSAVSACVRGLALRGVGLAIDDFGTGYSSLAYLKRLPVSKIKIDKTFVQDIGRDAENEAVVLAVIALAKSLGKAVIAEGVETQLQLRFLRQHGCDEVQGFLLGRPTNALQFRRLLEARNVRQMLPEAMRSL